MEIGPVVFFRAAQRSLLLAKDVAEGMGYGTEIAWHALLSEKGLRMGIIDAVRINHVRPIGGAYDLTEQRALGAQRLADAGFTDWKEAQQTLSRWWWWQAVPPWKRIAATPNG